MAICSCHIDRSDQGINSEVLPTAAESGMLVFLNVEVKNLLTSQNTD